MQLFKSVSFLFATLLHEANICVASLFVAIEFGNVFEIFVAGFVN